MESAGKDKFSESTVIRAESGIFGFVFLIVFADSAILFGEHLILDVCEGTRFITNFIGLKSMSYWAGMLAVDYPLGLIPLVVFLILGMAGVIMPTILYFWVHIFSGIFFWF